MEFTVPAIVDALKSRSLDGKTYYDILDETILDVVRNVFGDLDAIVDIGINTRNYDNLDSVLLSGAVMVYRELALPYEIDGKYEWHGSNFGLKFLISFTEALETIIKNDDDQEHPENMIFQYVDELADEKEYKHLIFKDGKFVPVVD